MYTSFLHLLRQYMGYGYGSTSKFEDDLTDSYELSKTLQDVFEDIICSCKHGRLSMVFWKRGEWEDIIKEGFQPVDGVDRPYAHRRSVLHGISRYGEEKATQLYKAMDAVMSQYETDKIIMLCDKDGDLRRVL